MQIQSITASHWPDIKRIYLEGIKTGQATFETKEANWEIWDIAHHDFCRFVAVEDEEVLGWAAISPTSKREVYKGVAEVSIYIGEGIRGKGIGKKLFTHLIVESEKKGIWTLQSSLFPENIASVNLHYKLGFQEVGVRKKVAQHYGIWRDTLIMEKRSKLEKFN